MDNFGVILSRKNKIKNFIKTLDKLKYLCYNIGTVNKERLIEMRKEIWFDMDGTLADLYGVEGWKNFKTKTLRPMLKLNRL